MSNVNNIYEKKEASVSEISNAFIKRIKNLNPKINAYLEVFEKESNCIINKKAFIINMNF